MFQVTSLLWLVNLKPAVEVAVAVEGVDVGEDSPSKMSQDHYLARAVRRGTQQDVAHRRKAMLRQIWRATSWSPVTSLPKQSSP